MPPRGTGSRSQRADGLCRQEVLDSRNKHTKYEQPVFYSSKVSGKFADSQTN